MDQNIMTAAREFANRPKDEQFPTLQALVQAAQYDKDHSRERTYNLRDLAVVEHTDKSLVLQSPKGIATFTHYSFGQFARTLGAPAAYLRVLSPDVAARAMNDNIHHNTALGTDVNLLVRANGGTPVVRACTSDTYGRVWDAQLYGEINHHFGDGVQTRGTGVWQAPPVWKGLSTHDQIGGYRGDRDSFVLRINGGSMVTDPSIGFGGNGNGTMFRGIMVRNSEVGHCSISIECVLYRAICGNHILWGALIDRKFRRRHVGKDKITRDVMRELVTLAYQFNNRTAAEDEKIIGSLIKAEIATTKDAVVAELRKLGSTKEQAEAAYDACERTEQVSPRSYWGMAQGLTRTSQESGFQDDRLFLDQLAAAVLKRGQLVTV